MSKAVLDVSMSLDGFTAGPDVGNAEPMGEGGERLHERMWMAGNGPDGGVDIGFRCLRVSGLRHPPRLVRGCTRDGPPGSPRPRTYGVQRRRGEADPDVRYGSPLDL